MNGLRHMKMIVYFKSVNFHLVIMMISQTLAAETKMKIHPIIDLVVFIVLETGAVFTFGKSKFADNSPNKFWIRNDKVTQIACGDEHTCLVAESGRVFTFGANDWGQLGLGHTKIATKPSCIKCKYF